MDKSQAREEHGDRSFGADDLDVIAAQKLLKWASTEPEESVILRGRPNTLTLQRRLKYLRAAFVGDVRMSLLALLAFSITWVAAWVAAYGWYQALEREENTRVQVESQLDQYRQLFIDLSRVRDSQKENEEMIQAIQLVWNALQEDAEKQGLQLDSDQ